MRWQAVVRFLWDAHNCEEAREEEELVVSTPYIEHWNELIDLWYLGMQVASLFTGTSKVHKFVLSKSRSSRMFWPLFPGSLILLLTPGGPKRSSGNLLHLKIHFSPAIRLFWWELDWWWLHYFLSLLTWGPTEMNHVSLTNVSLPSKILHLVTCKLN